MRNEHPQMNAKNSHEIMSISEAFEIKKTLANKNHEDLNGLVKLNEDGSTLAIADPGSLISFINEKTTQRLGNNGSSTRFEYIPTNDAARHLA